MPSEEGFVSMFNGTDLSGWQGLVENPVARAKMTRNELATRQKIADREMHDFWSVKDGAIWFSGEGANLCSIKEYGDFEMLVDWRITKKGDSGIYLRGTPQVQIWDTSRVEVETPLELGKSPYGERRIINIKGGAFSGPRLSGRVLPGGADWQIIRYDGITEVEARYTLETEDGALIYVSNWGLRHGPKEVMARLAGKAKRPGLGPAPSGTSIICG